ncbi:TIGR03899 family protein [Chromobacterium violaceum]|uniref:TIGR03899 family protein n=1 Tax=Chromobacterium violaceum TaxID=536 RepID=A0A202BEB5_CHRVL|nr:TIGR03899 family protein [Chromobacterium violaceum]MBA8737118.1 TIGR03899 family protein [Chromobacterium violaceum]OVE49884.1 TIGR03899 family protein [Chromobacterium violaceum]
MDDLLGLGKGTDKLIAAVERALGAVYRPYGIRRDADAEAYRLTTLEAAKTDAKSRNTLELARAKSEADIILAEGKQALEDRLEARLQHKALQQQLNIERIVEGALTQPQPAPTTEEVDQDWLSNFFEHAQSVSGAEMQALWSRVLTLEVGTPGTFSSRALEVLRKMTRREASSFQTACKLAGSFTPKDGRKAILHGALCHNWFNFSETPEIDLNKFGLPFLDRMNLAQIGLVYEDGLVSGDLPREHELSFYFTSTQLKLRAKRSGLQLQNYALTPIGLELSALVSPEEDSAYIATLCTSLAKFFHVRNENI